MGVRVKGNCKFLCEDYQLQDFANIFAAWHTNSICTDDLFISVYFCNVTYNHQEQWMDTSPATTVVY